MKCAAGMTLRSRIYGYKAGRRFLTRQACASGRQCSPVVPMAAAVLEPWRADRREKTPRRHLFL